MSRYITLVHQSSTSGAVRYILELYFSNSSLNVNFLILEVLGFIKSCCFQGLGLDEFFKM